MSGNSDQHWKDWEIEVFSIDSRLQVDITYILLSTSLLAPAGGTDTELGHTAGMLHLTGMP
jgi:hypothetical protein